VGIELKVEQVLDELLEAAKWRRASIPYSDNEGMEQMLVFVGPQGEIASQTMTWNSEREKYAKMRAVSEVAQKTFTVAIVMISDTRFVRSEKFEKYFHLPPISEVGLEKFQQEYKTILNGIYGGLIRNLPRELWTEAVMTVIKGPLIPCQSRLAAYIEGPNDSIQFIETEDTKGEGTKFNLLPDWWV
jgi:hypothetical protein